MKNKKIYLIFMSLLLALAFLPFGATKKTYAYAFDDIEMLQESTYYNETVPESVTTNAYGSSGVGFKSGTYFLNNVYIRLSSANTFQFYFIRNGVVSNSFRTASYSGSYYLSSTTTSYNIDASYYIRFYYNDNVVYDSYSNYVNSDYLELYDYIDNFYLSFYRVTSGSTYVYAVSAVSLYIDTSEISFDNYLPQLMSFDVWGVGSNKLYSYYQIGSYSDYDHIDNLDDYYLGYSRGQASGSGGGFTQSDIDNATLTGYNNGLNAAANDVLSLHSLVFSIIDAPFNVIRNAFNFEIFGINFSSIVTAIVTALLIVWVIKRFR